MKKVCTVRHRICGTFYRNSYLLLKIADMPGKKTLLQREGRGWRNRNRSEISHTHSQTLTKILKSPIEATRTICSSILCNGPAGRPPKHSSNTASWDLTLPNQSAEVWTRGADRAGWKSCASVWCQVFERLSTHACLVFSTNLSVIHDIHTQRNDWTSSRMSMWSI